MLTVGSLFSGIGGFDLGLERAGMRTVWFCEQDPYCQRVLTRHWPGIPIHPDVRALVADPRCVGVERGRVASDVACSTRAGASEGTQRLRLRDTTGDSGEARPLPVPVPYVDVLAGGFPCQDLSYAGAGAGLNGARSGLWSEYAHLIRDLRPRYVVVENVSALLARGMGRVLADLATLGYDAEWDCIPAAAVGAPHRRDRVWLVAYPNSQGEPYGSVYAQTSGYASDAGRRDLANADRKRPQGWRLPVSERAEKPWAGNARDMADTSSIGYERTGQAWNRRLGSENGGSRGFADHWLVEPDVGRVANGVPHRVDRLRSLGNALVPQIAEWIGQRIIAAELEAHA